MASLPKVLLVEDNLISQQMVRNALASFCSLDIAASGEQAFNKFEESSFDLVLLDVGLPDMDGFELYDKFRSLDRNSDTPIVFLTARGATDDKVQGFNLGADDYIVKPFDMVEFKARIESKLKKLKNGKQKDTFRIGPFEVRGITQKIVIFESALTSRTLELTSNQFKLLSFLLHNEGKIFSRDEILKQVWGKEIHVTGRTIDTHIYSIRQQLGPLSDVLKSIHGKGYCISLGDAKFEKKLG